MDETKVTSTVYRCHSDEVAILDFEMAMELSENIIIDIERCRLYVLKVHLGQGRLQNSKPGKTWETSQQGQGVSNFTRFSKL